MKKNRIIIKTSILLLMFILACSFLTKTHAVTDIESATSFSAIQTALTSGDGKISLNYGNAVQNKYIFCRDKAKDLPQNREFVYSMDGNAVTYPNNNQGAAWAYLFGKNFSRKSTVNFSDGRLQNLFWEALGGENYDVNYFKNNTTPKGTSNEINEANAYGELISSGTKINKDSFTKNDITVPSSLMNLGYYTYGPFSIDCESWIYNGELKAGISEFYVYAKKDGQVIQPSYIILSNYEAGSVMAGTETGVYGHWFGAWDNRHTFTYTNFKDNIIDFNNNYCSTNKNFYIHLDQEIESISIKVKYKYIDASVNILPIKAENFTSYKAWCPCDLHTGYTFVNGKGYNKNYIYVENGKLYKFKGYTKKIYRRYDIVEIIGEASGTYINSSNGHSKINVPQYFKNHYPYVNPDNTKCGSYYPATGGGWSPLILGHIGEAPSYDNVGNSIYWMYYENFRGTYTNSYDVIPAAGAIRSFMNSNHKISSGYLYEYRIETHEPVYEQLNCSCALKTITKDDIKKLVVVNPTFKEGTNIVETEQIDIYKPTIEIKIENYNINDYGKDNKVQLENQTFSIKSVQNELNIYDDDVSVNDVVTINADVTLADKNVYVTIEEKTAPLGYDTLNEKINFIAVYNQTNLTYGPKFTPTNPSQEGDWPWNDESTFGGWEYFVTPNDLKLNDETGEYEPNTNLPNTYRSKSGDIIEVDLIDNVYIIKVYNNPKPIKLKLNKLGSYYELPKELDGAEFTIKASQKNGDEYEPIDIKTSIIKEVETSEEPELIVKNGTGKLEQVYNNELIEIFPKYVDSNKIVYISITETMSPQGYMPLSRPIIMQRVYNVNYGAWNPGYRIKDEIEGKKAFGDDYTLWSWVLTNEDLVSDGKYSSKLPNLYCYNINELGDVEHSRNYDEITEDFMRQCSEISDIIYVETNSQDGGEIINIYNTQKLAQINLTKEDMYENVVQGAKFSGSISNIKSFELPKGNKITPQNDNTYTFTNLELTSGNLSLYDIVYEDSSKPVIVTLQETGVPEGYRGFTEEFKIAIPYNRIEEATLSYGGEYVGLDAYLAKDGGIVDIMVKNERLINISGIVWLDGGKDIKTSSPNGRKDIGEYGIEEEVFVYLYNNSPDGHELVDTTVSNKITGQYEFKDIPYRDYGYYVVYEYNGVRYKATSYNAGGSDMVSSHATENVQDRNALNRKFYKIISTYAINYETGGITEILYNQTQGTNSSLPISQVQWMAGTTDIYGIEHETINPNFIIHSTSETVYESTNSLNFGLVIRGTDIAATTSVESIKTLINGKEANQGHNSLVINGANLIPHELLDESSIYSSDYSYQKRKFINNTGAFKEELFTDNTDTSSNLESGNELEMYVKYRIDLINEGPERTYISGIQYNFDSNYIFDMNKTIEANPSKQLSLYTYGNLIEIDLSAMQNIIQLNPYSSNTIYLVFKLPKDQIVQNRTYCNTVEITEYSTDSGVIDIDSQPGNLNYNSADSSGTFEDDSFKSLHNINIVENSRQISGYVFEDVSKDGIDNDDNSKINDVIVQLIEVKKVSNSYVEYIWQETISGSDNGKRVNSAGTAVEAYEYINPKEAGRYEFNGFIPGNYIVRFIYGDGTSVDSDLNGNILKYNGQDYKSTIDSYFNETNYDSNHYSSNESVARDNEARRLETMAYAVNVDKEKGLLLRLLDVNDVESLNATEIKTLAEIIVPGEENEGRILLGNEANLQPSEISKLNEKLILLQQEVLANTWMCAETSIINVEINPSAYSAINFGLQERPKVSMELKKVITGLKVVASNGQVLVNMVIDVNDYLNGDNLIKGIANGVTLIKDTELRYEVGTPTELNTIIEGASMQFTYTVVAKNISEEDYLSRTLMEVYNDPSKDYVANISRYASEAKEILKTTGHIGGDYLGMYYYKGETPLNNTSLSDQPTKLEMIGIKDYVNNNLSFVRATDGVIELSPEQHYILNDDNSLNIIPIKTVLKFESSTGKLKAGDVKTMYSVMLEPTHLISVGGTKEFKNYIAEVMEYSSASGRRAVYTSKVTGNSIGMAPDNAEIVSHEYREGYSHEPDEADTLDIKLGTAAGQDKKMSYIWMISIIASLSIIGIGIFTIKKFVIK